MLKTIIPSSTILKKHIECFYTYGSEAHSNFSYLAFPHCHTGLSFFKGATIRRDFPRVEISANNQNDVKIELLGKYNCPVLIEYTGKLKEISIVFKPLGINHFFRENYHSMAPEFSQELATETWRKFGEKLVFDETDMPVLESFLLSQFKENPALAPFEKSVSILSDLNDDNSVKQIASQLGYNLKTFQRHFKKHLGNSPIEFRRVFRFRNSIVSKLDNHQLKTLTEITYEGGYYDQSYFIKEFRKLTNHNPKDFFKVAKKVDGDKLVWEIK